MMFIYKSRYGRDHDKDKCRASVHSGTSCVFHQCHRKGIVEREFEGEALKFCRQHDPEIVKAKREARDAKWRAEWAARDASQESAKRNREALDECKKAIELIAAGHNDPRTLAIETLNKFPGEIVTAERNR